MKSKAEDIINEAIDDIRKQSIRNERNFVDLLIGYILELDTKGGNFLKGGESKGNRKKIFRLEKVIDDFLTKTGYFKDVNNFLVNFDEIEENNKSVHKEINGIKVKKGLISDIRKNAITATIDGLTNAGLSFNLKEPIKNVLFDAVASGGSLKDILKQVRDIGLTIQTGENRKQGILLRHVTQVSRDALQQFNGNIHNTIRQEFNLNGFAYIGGLVRDSRPQCIRWTKKGELKHSELNREISWAYRNGAGMIKGTTPDNFIRYRGGYSCRHEAIPKRV